jgi:hypothetical protein
MTLSTRDLPVPATLIPELLRASPHCRPVLDRYGLRGCGGPLGPYETLEFFARAHDVPLDRLLEELGQALASERLCTTAEETAAPLLAADSRAPQDEIGESLADSIYRPFFRAGITVVLTLGAAWGALLLLRIAGSGSFATATLHEVNAHGHAQIFGWVGLFVMGFAYQAFPRFKHTTLKHPRLAYSTLWLMLVGLTCRAVLEPLVATWPRLGVPAVLGSIIEIIAIGIFVWLIVATLKGAPKPLEFYDAYILTALAWFFLQAVYETVYFTATIRAVDRPQLLNLIATWQGPLRDMQIHGFALMMILGVSQRMFHYFYGFPSPHARRSLILLAALNLAVVGELAGFILMRTAGHAWAAVWYGAVVVLALSVTLLVYDWHSFSRPLESDRSLKFLRTAYVWLFVSLGMLVLLPVYQFAVLPWLAPDSAAVRIGFSHAYHGTVRHAITVGFVSLMIMGVAGKVVPTLAGMDVRRLRKLWIPFVFVNAGCLLRVCTQTLTDFTPAAYPVAGVSGLLELTGLTVWGISLWQLMRNRHVVVSAGSSDRAIGRFLTGPITGESIVSDVLDQYPWLLDAMVEAGFRPLRNPLLRNTLARWTTIGQACRQMGIEEVSLLASLNEKRIRPAGTCPPAENNLPLVILATAQENGLTHPQAKGRLYVH